MVRDPKIPPINILGASAPSPRPAAKSETKASGLKELAHAEVQKYLDKRLNEPRNVKVWWEKLLNNGSLFQKVYQDELGPFHFLCTGTEKDLRRDLKKVETDSLSYKYMNGSDSERQVFNRACKVFAESYSEARRFFNDPNMVGMALCGKRDKSLMLMGHTFGVHLTTLFFDELIEALEKNNTAKIDETTKFIKGAFVHEETHVIRDEEDFGLRRNQDHEIASHVVQFFFGQAEDTGLNEAISYAKEKFSRDSFDDEIDKNYCDVRANKVPKVIKHFLDQEAKLANCNYPKDDSMPALVASVESAKNKEQLCYKLAHQVLETSTSDLAQIAI